MWTIRVWIEGRELKTEYCYSVEWAAERMARKLNQLSGVWAVVKKIKEDTKEDEKI